jgi:autotransporter-associated beta strand protein
MNRKIRFTNVMLLATGLMAALSQRTEAQTYRYWDTDGTHNGSLVGGSGTWDTTATKWSTTASNTGGSDVAWGNANGWWAVFGAPAGVVTVSGTIWANSVTFTTTGYVLTNGAINPGSIGAVTTAGAGTTNTIHSIWQNGYGLNVNGGGVLVMAGNNTFYNGSTIYDSTVIMTATNSGTGAMRLYSGGNLVLNGALGRYPGCTNFLVEAGGLLKLDNATTANNTNRINNIPVTMKGGALSFANDGGNAVFLEDTGTNVIALGSSTVQADQAGASGSSILRFLALSRLTGATVNYTGTGLGLDARNSIAYRAAPAMDDGLLGGWATADNEFAKYVSGSVTSVTALTSGDYTANTEPNWVASDNVKLSASQVLTGSRQINSLNLAQAGDTTVDIGAAQTLRLESGGLLVSGSYNAALTGGTLTAGTGDNAAGEVILHQNSANSMTVSSAIANNGAGAVGLTKSGTGSLTLSGANSFTGPIFVNAGRMNTLSGAFPGVSNTVSVAAGTVLDLGGFTGVGSVAGLGQLTNYPSLTLGYDGTSPTFSGTLATTGMVTKIGTGLQVFTSANLGTGGLTVHGNLVLSGTNTLTRSGSPHSIVIDGGTLIANGGVGATTFGTTAVVSNVNGILLKNNGTLVWTNSTTSGPGRTLEVAAGSTGVLVTASAMASGIASAGHVYLRGPADCRMEKYGAGTYTLGGNGEGFANFTGTFVVVQGKVDVNNNGTAQFGQGQLIVQPGAEFFGSKKNVTLTNAVINGGILSFKGNDGSTGWTRIPDSLQGTTTLTNGARIIVARNNTGNKTMSGNNVIFQGDLVVTAPTAGSSILYDDTADGLTNANTRLLLNNPRTFIVDNGPAVIDFDVGVPVQTNTTSSSLIKAGTGTMRLAWINPCHGNSVALGGVSITNILSWAAVSNGTLLVDGILSSTGGVTVVSGATLGGTGLLECAVSVLQGGTLQAGDTDAQGTLTLASNLTLASGSTNAVRLTSAGNNRIVMTGGTAELNGAALAVTLNFAPTPGQTFTLIESTAPDKINGSFAAGIHSTYNGKNYPFSASTVGSTVVLKAHSSGTLITIF